MECRKDWGDGRSDKERGVRGMEDREGVKK